MTQVQTTRDRILHRGLALMSKSGLDGVTLGVLADQVGMSKSGLFAHFKSKDEVQIELLEFASRFGRPYVVEPAMQEPDGLPRLRALVRNWLGWAPRSGLPGGCPMAAGMFEYDDKESPVRNKIAELEAAWRALLCNLTQRAVALGHLRKGLDVEQFVWELSGIYLAHHVSQRFLRSNQSDRRAVIAFDALVERSLPVRNRGKSSAKKPTTKSRPAKTQNKRKART
jgi:AcrR family transcriptional regulator